MKAIISRENTRGEIAEVGMNDRMLVSDLTTERGVIRRAKQYANGKRARIEFFTDAHFYGEPFKTIFLPSLGRHKTVERTGD